MSAPLSPNPSGTSNPAKKMNATRAAKELVLRTKPLKRVVSQQPLHVVIVLSTMLAATFLYIIFYSAVFVGSDGLFITYVDWYYVTCCLAAGFFILSTLLLFDADDWHNRPICGTTLGRVLQTIGVVSVSGFTLVGALLSAE